MPHRKPMGLLQAANGISADGLTIVGTGINPDGFSEAWIATLPPPTDIPTVSEWGMVAMALLILAAGTMVFMRRRTDSQVRQVPPAAGVRT